MSGAEFQEDPILQELYQIREEAHQHTKNMTDEEMSKWYREEVEAFKSANSKYFQKGSSSR